MAVQSVYFLHGFLTMRFTIILMFSLFLFVPHFNFGNDIFDLAVQAIPLFEAAFTRCTVILILSYMWLQRSEQPLFGTSRIRNILISRALVGCLSLSSFVFWWETFWIFSSQSLYSFQHIIYHFVCYCLISLLEFFTTFFFKLS